MSEVSDDDDIDVEYVSKSGTLRIKISQTRGSSRKKSSNAKPREKKGCKKSDSGNPDMKFIDTRKSKSGKSKRESPRSECPSVESSEGCVREKKNGSKKGVIHFLDEPKAVKSKDAQKRVILPAASTKTKTGTVRYGKGMGETCNETCGDCAAPMTKMRFASSDKIIVYACPSVSIASLLNAMKITAPVQPGRRSVVTITPVEYRRVEYVADFGSEDEN